MLTPSYAFLLRPNMSADETNETPTGETITSLTFKLPVSLREQIKNQADAEQRSEAGFLRFHLAAMFEAKAEVQP